MSPPGNKENNKEKILNKTEGLGLRGGVVDLPLKEPIIGPTSES